jgi:hypothetical protein
MKLVREPIRPTPESSVVVWLMAFGLLLAARFYPFDRMPVVACPLKTLAHIPCPTCGMTRAFVRVTHGEWLAAWHVSPLGAVLAVVTAGVAGYGVLRLTVWKSGLELRLTSREALAARVATAVAILGNWVYLIISGAAAYTSLRKSGGSSDRRAPRGKTSIPFAFGSPPFP